MSTANTNHSSDKSNKKSILLSFKRNKKNKKQAEFNSDYQRLTRKQELITSDNLNYRSQEKVSQKLINENQKTNFTHRRQKTLSPTFCMQQKKQSDNSKKKKMRRDILQNRRLLSTKDRERRSRLICQKLAELDSFKKAKNILFYHALDDEVSLNTLLVRTLAQKKKNVFLPRLERNKEITVRPYRLGDKLQTSFYNIREPLPKTEVVDPLALDLVILPCVAADSRCFRLGFGLGCYDKFLAKFNGTSVIAAFDLQVVDRVPRQDHDLKAQFLITESQIYANANSQ